VARSQHAALGKACNVAIPIGSLSSRLFYLPNAYRWRQIKIPVLLPGKLAVTYDNNPLTALEGTCTFSTVVGVGFARAIGILTGRIKVGVRQHRVG